MKKRNILMATALFISVIMALAAKASTLSVSYYYIDDTVSCVEKVFTNDPCPGGPIPCTVLINGVQRQLYTEPSCTTIATRP